jgi:hypothetical protein
MKCNPILLTGIEDRGRLLDRIESRPNDTKDEAWLQALIYARPELLPVSDFDESLGDLIPLGREISNPSGYIDALFTTGQGQLVIVETKLWKNPEKHREVVVQIIDYAKELANWSYDDLDSAAISAARAGKESRALSIQERVTPHLTDSGMQFDEFQELLIENMASGRFLLLIVGDRISPNVALLSAAIHGVPGLEFQFGLVELQMHQLDEGRDWPLLIVPEIVGRTVEETRAVVKIQYKEERPQVDVAVPAEADSAAKREKVSLESLQMQLPEDMQAVFEQWSARWQERGWTFNFGTWGIGFHAPIEGSPRSIFEVYPDGITLRTNEKRKSIDPDPEQYKAYLENLSSVPKARERLAAGHRKIQLKMLTAVDYDTIFQANFSYAEMVADKPESR